ncbi:uncharacterized protein FIESC28_05861 [Fusarium coffeatum]|uniref:Uncharacterized protein n=1 Tax=Fusarium coffeatum TaxID=231269 RepID=A0A366RNX2_9HYPO|nr:uncharacterized protein FIESC28_05861 [Fusarium coffeatum]RBR18811.1 hypothetical protein FIESC28_05861 [Fusarium coffeatum]
MYREHHPGSLALPTTTWSPSEEPTNKSEHEGNQRSRQASTCSERSCESMTLDETRELWRYMAVDAGEDGIDLMPANRFIIDTLNESVIDLPDEGRELLNRYLCPSSPSKQKWKFWKKE